VTLPSPEDATDEVSETLHCLVFRKPNNGKVQNLSNYDFTALFSKWYFHGTRLTVLQANSFAMQRYE
jgi:hypothetical protein